MKHKIRINGEAREFDCELGSGIKDKNGREIFEGDLIKNPNCNPNDVMDTPEYVIAYDPEEMAFVYRDPVLHRNNCEPFPNDLLSDFNGELEVIGHAAENWKESEQMTQKETAEKVCSLLAICAGLTPVEQAYVRAAKAQCLGNGARREDSHDNFSAEPSNTRTSSGTFLRRDPCPCPLRQQFFG